MKVILLFLILLLALVQTACKVGPAYRAPQSRTERVFDQARLSPGLYSTENVVTNWWRTFGDPDLQRILSLATTNSPNIRIALERIQEARALSRFAGLQLLPSVGPSAGYTHQLQPKALLPGTSRDQRTFEIYDAGFDATWELDVFGRVRRSYEAARADLAAVEADTQYVLLSLRAEVIRTYFELRGFQQQLEVARHNAQNQSDTLVITQARLKAGRGTELDVARSDALHKATLAIIPSLQTSVDQSIHRLAVLSGQQPGFYRDSLSPIKPLPALPDQVEVGDAAQLIRRRPDIRSAERQIASATARIGVATADLFPRVTLNGRIGFESATLSGLADAGADTHSFGPRISWAALDIPKTRAQIQAAGARARAALANYDATVLAALEETENALSAFDHHRQRLVFLNQSRASAQTAVDLAKQRYEKGVTDFLTLLEAERSLLQSDQQLAEGQTQAVTSLVALLKALGAE